MIINASDLPDIRDKHRDETIALRFGCYDLLHEGHRNSIESAAFEADKLVVGVMPDEYVARVKGPSRPINDELTRVHNIDQLELVDYSFVAPAGVIALAGVMRKLHPDIYAESEEYQKSSWLKGFFLDRIGVNYMVDRPTEGISSSRIISELGNKAAALARPGLSSKELQRLSLRVI